MVAYPFVPSVVSTLDGLRPVIGQPESSTA
jgi:hypothetical protein